jgi:hypothetical protein
MTRRSIVLVRLLIATMLGGAAFLWSGQLPLGGQSSLVSSAEARIGRPLTPMSYAGVARRTTRRAVAVGAVATGAAVVAAPACTQVVDAYGRIATVCRWAIRSAVTPRSAISLNPFLSVRGSSCSGQRAQLLAFCLLRSLDP